MMDLQAIIHEFLALSGILAWFGVAAWLFYWTTERDRKADLQLTVLDSDLSKDDCISYVTSTNDTGRFGENKSVADWLDDAIEPRAKLQYIHRKLCERVGIDPSVTNELGDLITEAVYDGFRRNACINRVNEAAFHKESQQSA